MTLNFKGKRMLKMNTNVIRESARGYQPLALADVLLQERKIFITTEVNSDTCTELIKQLMFLENDNPEEEIRLYINSPGGDVYGGLAVYDCMRMLKSPITTICIGTAASMGAILFLAGEKRLMLPSSRVMIHDPSFSGGSIAGKKPQEIQTELDSLTKVKTELCNIISERTGKPVEQITEITKEDTYYSATEAVNFGFATGIATSI